MSAPLSYSAEWARQVGRRRTKWILAVLLGLPVIFIAAFALDRGPRAGGGGGGAAAGGTRMVDLATSGGGNFAVFALMVSGEFLLLIVAALLAGDPVPAEASWSSLRYLLVAPVRRARLLTSKLLVGLSHLWLAVLILPVWALLIGSLVYGTAPFSVPGGGQMPYAELLPRLLVAVAYLFVSTLPIASIAFAIGVGTDTPLAAVGGALVVLIVSGILDTIDAVGSLRNALPGHYSRAWLDLFQSPIDWTAMRHGVLWSLLWAIVFIAVGYLRFERRDVLS